MFVFFVLIWFYKASNSVYLVITVNTICFCDEDLSFLLLFLVFCKRCMFILYASFSLIGCAGSVGISLASRVMYIFRVCVSLLCGVPCRYNFIWVLRWCGRRDCTDFPFSWLCSGGYGTVELARGGGPFFLCFLQFAVCSLGGWVSAVGIFVLYNFGWWLRDIFLRFPILQVADCQQFITGGFAEVRTLKRIRSLCLSG